MAPAKIPALLTDEEFTAMMQKCDSAGLRMAQRLALKRATPNDAAPNQLISGSSETVADQRKPIDEPDA
ncbi:hypothetical protein [Pseudomonas rhodesiae]|jgi:hypothetical protein|uniref:hypothetical protein n=1 Tax=Pseudomonas rhodesiae TaxID=76760 RepID=UPI0027369AEB|nr:hypothetical protein [Pseudomonas rhodesiae]EKT4482668.1 hypothetical protein [Pseudomonas putida]MDE1529253.1 hypothetical protein [Pseudomonas carnis]WLG42021.1 hypothetical protein PSH93_12965 [Pseudomonas rhodesiae]